MHRSSASLVREYSRITGHIQQLQRHADALHDELISRFAPGDYLIRGGKDEKVFTLSIKKVCQRRFNSAAFKAENPTLYDTFRHPVEYLTVSASELKEVR